MGYLQRKTGILGNGQKKAINSKHKGGRKMKKALIVTVILFCFIAFSSVQAEQINLVGSSTIRPVVKAIGKIFAKETGIKVIVKGGGSSVGVKSTANGSADIGDVSRELKPSEPKDLVAHTIGWDGVAMIVNSSNSISAITKSQVIDIYTGKNKNWKGFGGADKAITVETKAEGRSTKELFEKFFGLEGKVISSAHVIGSNTEAIAFVAGDPDSIGYVSIGTAEGASKKGVGIKLLDLEGVKATIANVKNKSYPLLRPLNLVTKGQPTGNAKKFIDFVLSPKGQKIVENKEFVKVK